MCRSILDHFHRSPACFNTTRQEVMWLVKWVWRVNPGGCGLFTGSHKQTERNCCGCHTRCTHSLSPLIALQCDEGFPKKRFIALMLLFHSSGDFIEPAVMLNLILMFLLKLIWRNKNHLILGELDEQYLSSYWLQYIVQSEHSLRHWNVFWNSEVVFLNQDDLKLYKIRQNKH